MRRFIILHQISDSFYEDFRFPAYTYDKLVCALIDAHQFAGMQDAFAILDMTTDTALRHLPSFSWQRVARPAG